MSLFYYISFKYKFIVWYFWNKEWVIWFIVYFFGNVLLIDGCYYFIFVELVLVLGGMCRV